MCFSASVSFISSGVLTATGVATLKQVENKKEIPVAIAPLIFALQQLMEGIIWITPASTTGNLTRLIAGYIFLTVAYFIWPVMAAPALMLIEKSTEKNKLRKNILKIFAAIGIFIGVYLLFFFIKNPLTINIIDNHIAYLQKIPYQKIIAIIYLIVISGSCLISSHKWIKIFGATILLALAVALKFYYVTFGSVWCFFAAISSLMIYWHFKNRKRVQRKIIFCKKTQTQK